MSQSMSLKYLQGLHPPIFDFLKNMYVKNHTYTWVGKTLDIVVSTIISMYDVDKTYNSILKVPWFHTPASHFFTKWTWHHGRYFRAKNYNDRLITHFWWQFFAHFLSEIMTKHNIKETAIKGNIWGPSYIPKGLVLGGG